ncbi:MAG: nucleotidyl transferase AbiEii/AbiGii toxin family protein [Nitrospirae bacterium]|nr:nucleotidyl transferase AbiEii/AbiGii toxin family protein [Nitrospirota bacterium]
MTKYTTMQYVELFHLLFFDQLGQKLDKRFYALKGGCNLRFYLKSIRYSEDLDIDIQIFPKDKLRDMVSGILKSKPFTQILQVYGLMIGRWSEPKQTETTQRWKVGLSISESDILLPTKIEFSRRGMKGNTVFEAIDPELVRNYHLSPIMANHYDSHSTYEQKVEALITRSTPQARDIFDLNLLLNTNVDRNISSGKLRNRIHEAKSNVMSVTFEIFKSQVLSYLHPDYQKQYDSASVWDNIVLKVMEALNGETL